MKIFKNILWLGLMGTLLLPSCQKYLDIKPKSQIKQEALFETEKGFIDALAGSYTLMSRRTLYGDNLTMSFLDVLAQRYRVDKTTSPYWDMAHYSYENDGAKLSVKQTIRSVFAGGYEVIANVNNMLDHMDTKKTLFQGDHYNLIKGEGLAIRALMHFDMLRLFGPIYKQEKDGLAIPYRVHISKETQPLLPAIEVAGLILKDLLEAETLLSKDPILQGGTSIYPEFMMEFRKHRMNLVAVQALLARVYLYVGDKAKAFDYAKKTIGQGTFTFVTSSDASADGACRDRTYRFEHLFSVEINNMKPYTDAYFNTAPTTYENEVLSNDESVINELFERSSTDIRRINLWERKDGKLVHSKFWQLETQIGACNWAKNFVPVIRISEVYYIAAEAAPTISEGVMYLNEVRSNRGLDPISNNVSAENFQLEIQKEYQKEFFSEGQLFYYYKRQGLAQIPGTTISADKKVYQLPLPVEERSL
ncbi:RagB/SusD family nutrient uptake outer membrane protein [Sphingobacterium faecale]|uniref:RagB/SusD family nutrient uptake outer membrane protein n=1 Tax=Sphingobacterium faecale TaxID=2803775 RepID=A0ABS1R3M6_9SPHI|nr:RagB/SusD family nutrient uptake outer membrane protein [Sphingobacterium faecale]MBL1408880.1 RagB/SusD family nutrient uptake outer membrane protein [Sphingobacterium faecale]